MSSFLLSKLAQAVTHLAEIREQPGSNLTAALCFLQPLKQNANRVRYITLQLLQYNCLPNSLGIYI
jgi:hypothetical protein